MRLGNDWTHSPVYANCLDIFNLRLSHKNTLKARPLRVVDYCGYILILPYPS